MWWWIERLPIVDAPFLADLPRAGPAPIGAGWVARGASGPPRRLPEGGLLPELSTRGPALAALDPELRALYEDTARFSVPVRPRWAILARWGRIAWVWGFARRWGQLELPTRADPALSNEIYEVDGARVWVRRYLDPAGQPTERVLYVARFDSVTVPLEPDPCVRIALPVAGGLWVAIFRAQRSRGRLVLTEAGGSPGGPGLYLVPDGGAPRYLRAFREELELSVVEGGLAAEHRFSLLGWRLLTLSYAIRGPESVAR
ncbi:MAG TPA: hypothetical protein ENK18_00160 [Deltaproteobacteria bacterium]|nr:hypothetical protein [Deltaproteobacteria bacterium]